MSPKCRQQLVRQRALAVRRAQHAIDRVRRTFAGLVEVPHLQLAQQAERNQLHARHDQHGGENQQRPVLFHHVNVPRTNFSTIIQNAISPPVTELRAPKVPKKCSGRDMYFSRKRMVIRSKKTRKVREMP